MPVADEAAGEPRDKSGSLALQRDLARVPLSDELRERIEQWLGGTEDDVLKTALDYLSEANPTRRAFELLWRDRLDEQARP